ncbi:hypothetical protein THAOC_34114 [Thalassiosira oceanica]|uniref:Uncharacterized protein n=1 Tax=Thalassiosira oceanica TaxID=159749 RepID=K0RKM4_THAOC|nr:hypothetical protein THAOC_34114 [Thalassiosira oceanica]|eukprot:EJK47187.1 hypothetical protein THAOC_34114 [Thalassiosira oceanica]
MNPKERGMVLYTCGSSSSPFMSRPVGSVKGSPLEQQNVKPMVYKVQIFQLGYPEPEDAFSSPPVKDPQSVNNCYAKEEYTPEDRRKARRGYSGS